MVEPEATSFPPPNGDMPEEIASDYLEAAAIAERSPRGAAALLRLCIEKLCSHLGFNKGSLDDRIGEMVAAGLPNVTTDALDVVRVIGNNAVHPGKIDVEDSPDTAAALARLINIIVEDRVSKPKHIDVQFKALPDDIRARIKARNTKAKGT
jgi:Domain of unknown function (DUF4145)